MLGDELRPGLWRWTGRYDDWKGEVASVALVSEAEVVLIDPLLDGKRWDRLERGLGERRLHVLLTIHWHARSAAEVVDRFPGTRVWAHSRNRAAVARRVPSPTSSGPATTYPLACSRLKPDPAARSYFGTRARGR